ncbi:SusC/RagA family TonB-linked outer membrane protein [Belliella sp. DSM 111904]|uniref:SusC/RagA family TonB-linked outer membrane protein n=1 Tax=Belliella filtrata TaxID=2923435 RepID=A0ABS9UXR3_9BACT|nr:SusC/RagA family TonB-linked outer membrane protein [Belliella filtrata]MCH7408505.1 SusC/RagA family TonB-linked outer membrane protein [Belliella filtrata]
MKKNLPSLFKRIKQRAMLICCFLGLLQNFAIAANTNAQQLSKVIINLSQNNQKVENHFRDIESQSSFKFSYQSGTNLKSEVSISKKEMPLDELLQEIATKSNLRFKQVNQVIAVNQVASTQNEQLVIVKGRVIEELTGEGLPGVNVVIQGKNKGTITGMDGEYSISVEVGDVLIFSYVGFKRQEYVIGNETTIDVTLTEDDSLAEIVVTALGIKREEKALGYASTTVNGEELTDALPNNWSDALTGKVAGLNLIKSGGGPAGSTQIILRGETSLTGDNSALIVVDGVVISGSSGQLTGQGSGSYLSADSPVDFGSSLSDINPDDIASVTVLKGPAAAALYGARGANGAIMITTKSGSSTQTKGLGITFSSNTAFDMINRWPDYQNEYGQGNVGGDLYYSYGATEDGPSTYSTSSAWGPRFDGQYYYQYNPDFHRLAPPERTLWQAYPNNRRAFFETGKTFTNNLAIQGGNARTRTRLSFTNMRNEWIVPNTGYNRTTVAFSLNHDITDKLSISTKVNYNYRQSDNLPTTGYNNQTIMYFIRGLVPNANMDWFRNPWVPGQEGVLQNRPFSNLLDNPYLQAYEMLNASERNGYVGTAQAYYSFTDELKLMVRTTIDMMYESRSQQRPMGTQKFVDGMYREQNIYAHEINSDFLLSYDYKRNKAFDFSMSVGGSLMKNTYKKDEYRAERLLFPGIYSFANSKDVLISLPFRRNYAVNSLYALGTFSYKNVLFLDVTGRQDWASTLASPVTGNVSPFFYPSVNLSAILSDAINMPRQIDYLKLRSSYASVGGGGTTAYLTDYSYGALATFPGGLTNPGAIPDPNLSFERTRSYEIGTDMKMFSNRFGLDVTLYHSNSFDQILSTPVDPASGYNSKIVNAGNVQNQGIEIESYVVPISIKNGLNWRVYGNFTHNMSKVIALADGMENMVLGTVFGSRGTVEARPGGRFGDLYGLGYERAPDGQILYENGYPVLGDSILFLGNATPIYRFGFGNEFKYKQFRVSILFDGQFGGEAYSLTHAVLMEEGKLNKTLPGRYNGIIGDGVIANGDGTYRPNDVVATSIRDYYFRHFNRDNLESNIFSTDYIKLREMRVDYKIPQKYLQRLMLQNATVGVYGRDLFVFTHWPSFDPEFGTLGNGDISKSAEIAQFPSTRTIGFNISLGI